MLDGKYNIQLVNKHTGSIIPDDEPVFILRARDIHAVTAMIAYAEVCKNQSQQIEVYNRIDEFQEWQINNQGKLKEPDC
jgi:hypothetical protein